MLHGRHKETRTQDKKKNIHKNELNPHMTHPTNDN
jgi:hypothetical protein